MEDIPKWLEVLKWFKSIGFELGLILAGLAGAFVNLTKSKKLTFVERVVVVVSGGLTANYLTPVLLNFLDANNSIKYGLAFILGYMGLKAVEYLIDFMHKKLDNKE